MRQWKAIKARASEHATLPALFLAFIGSAIAMQLAGNDYASALGSNLVAEFVGAAATVYGIDFLIKRREERRIIPVKAASYEDVRVMTHWALGLWKEAYIQSVGDSAPNSWRDLFSADSLDKIKLSLDITRPANTLPKQPWSSYFDGEMERIHKHAEKVLERHGGFLEPAVHNAVYAIVYYNHHKIANSIALDKHLGVPRPTNLGGYVPMIRDWFDAVLVLHDWTVTIHPYLTKHGITNIHAPYMFSQLEVWDNLPARFDEGVLLAQAQIYQQWQQQKAAQHAVG
ncbi:hypothetical protein VDF90_11935 [Xanthomonas campestris pv. raphani]|uniref:hypothetical protein n=1 Tax=Xanthomonas campestris TaxID=339 RepID=UPI002B2296CA|nr:hypothetical protein [Xanthomonas campestris]MEA9787942.1 hypothetical protein [Xanthomonas campestris pv. raphani]